MEDFDRLMRKMVDREPGNATFTLHLDFLAVDEEQARLRAEQYGQALGLLRGEIDFYQARVSANGCWDEAVPVYCNEPGPHPMDVCLLPAGHRGAHRGVGASEDWTDDEIPSAPDTIEGAEPDDTGGQPAGG